MRTRPAIEWSEDTTLPPDPVAISPQMVEVLRRAHVYAPAATPLVIVGETGTGKTYLAEYVHRLSGRPDGFHMLNVGTMDPLLVRDELFGHVAGGFTDGRRPREGVTLSSGRGTLLLDDFQHLDLGSQKKLLQVLDGGAFYQIGDDRITQVRCRFMFAMSESPELLVRQGSLTKELRFRLGFCELRVPTLAERRLEIPTLAQRFLASCPMRTGLDGPSRLAEEVLRVLENATYAGNLRELRVTIESAYLEARASHSERIEIAHLPEAFTPGPLYEPYGDARRNLRAITWALEMTGGRPLAAARLIGASRATVIRGRDRLKREGRDRVSNVSNPQ